MTTIGLPRQLAKEGYRRDFPPSFVHALNSYQVTILLEEQYGKDLHYDISLYKHKHVKIVPREQIFNKADIIIVLTAPKDEELQQLHAGQTLLSMLHFPTHPERKKLLDAKGVIAISLDEVKDSFGQRSIQDFETVANNALTEGFIRLRKTLGDSYWFDKKRGPIQVFQIGFGEVGKYAVQAALSMGTTGYRSELIKNHGNPLVEVIPTGSIHTNYSFINQKIISKSVKQGGYPHVLVDVSQRVDPTQTIINEAVLKKLPPETIIVDITADTYDGKRVVKGIQGIPTGNEKQYYFSQSDTAWTNTAYVPKTFQIPPVARRQVVSHYAWPSYGTYKERRKNVEKYSLQILALLPNILSYRKNKQLRKSMIFLKKIAPFI